MSLGWPWWVRWALGLWLVATATGASAQAGTLPFVEPGGVIRANLHYSDLVRALGEPPRSRLFSLDPGGTLKGGIVFEYPEQGLGFLIEVRERPKADPQISEMQVRAPAAARTPEGLAIGQPLAQAEPLIRAAYRVRHASSQGRLHSFSVSDASGRSERGATFRFNGNGTLADMRFSAATPPPQPWRAPRWLSSLLPLALLLTVALIATRVMNALGIRLPSKWDRRPDPDAPTPVRNGLGLMLIAGAGVLAVFGAAIVGGGGWDALLGLFAWVAALGLFLVALALLTRSGERWVRWVAGALLGALLLVYAISKLMG